MAYSQEVKDRVRMSYVRDCLPLKQAAERHGVPYDTVRTWKRKALNWDKDDWDEARNASRLIQGGSAEVTAAFMDDFVHIYHRTIKKLRAMMEKEDEFDPIAVAEALSKMADAWIKTTNALTKGKPSLNKLSVGLEVLQHFNDWIREYNTELAPEFVNVIEPFSAYLTQAMGK